MSFNRLKRVSAGGALIFTLLFLILSCLYDINYIMKMYKKTICLMLVTALLSVLCSCSLSGRAEPDIRSSAEETTSNTVTVTFPEGFTVSEIAARLEENGVCSADDFMAECNNTGYLDEFGIAMEHPENRAFVLEGYLFPDTYEFYRNENVSSVVKRFIRNFKSRITDEMAERASSLGYTLDEIITLASIIQEEAGNAADGKVSSVLHNRLSSPDFPKLQCDACTFYLRNSVKPYVSEEKYEEYLQLYSTYNCYGLPEGPITNPGIDSINAALYPEETGYYYFITDSDNNYIFAETWEQHQKNVADAGLD